MGERLTNVNNILEAGDDGLKYLKLNNFYNFREAETDATTLNAAIHEMGGDNTDYDTMQMIFYTIQKQEKKKSLNLKLKSCEKIFWFLPGSTVFTEAAWSGVKSKIVSPDQDYDRNLCNLTGKTRPWFDPEEICA